MVKICNPIYPQIYLHPMSHWKSINTFVVTLFRPPPHVAQIKHKMRHQTHALTQATEQDISLTQLCQTKLLT